MKALVTLNKNIMFLLFLLYYVLVSLKIDFRLVKYKFSHAISQTFTSDPLASLLNVLEMERSRSLGKSL